MQRLLPASVAALVPLLLCSLLAEYWYLESEDYQGTSKAFAADAEEGLELLQRRGGYVANLSSAAKVHAPVRSVDTKSQNVSKEAALVAPSDVSNASMHQSQTMRNTSEALALDDHIRAAVAAYALLPSAVAVGLPLLITGFGVIEVVATGAFWLLVRPAASTLQACWWMMDIDAAKVRLSQGPSLGFTPEALSILAHFYWAWGLGELVVRRRGVMQRLAAVLCLGCLLLPVPFAEVFLGHLGPHQVVSCALVGDVLGILLFFSLRLAPCWQLIKALPARGRASGVKDRSDAAFEALPLFHVYDNLSGFWGGCRWPQQRLQSKGAPFEGSGVEEPWMPGKEGKDSAEKEAGPDSSADAVEQAAPLDEDFLLVRCRGASAEASGDPESAPAE